jgi:hypothetical protein
MSANIYQSPRRNTSEDPKHRKTGERMSDLAEKYPFWKEFKVYEY